MEVFSSSSSAMSDGYGFHYTGFSSHHTKSSSTVSSPSYPCSNFSNYLSDAFEPDEDEYVSFDLPMQGYRLGPVGCHLKLQKETAQSVQQSASIFNDTSSGENSFSARDVVGDVSHFRTCSTIQALLENPWGDLSRIGKITVAPSQKLENFDKAALNFEISFKDNCVSSYHDIKFCMQDRIGCYTLLVGDVVNFELCVERRMGRLIIRAKRISVMSEYLIASSERRLKGVIYMYVSSKRYGYLLCTDVRGKVFFRADEFLDPEASIYVGQHVEFTRLKDSGVPIYQEVCAIRIQPLPFGSIKFGISIGGVYSGIVLVTPSGPYYCDGFNDFETKISKLRLQNKCTEAIISQLAAKELTQEDVQSHYEFAGKPGLVLFGTMTKHDIIDFYWNTCVDCNKIIKGCNVKLGVMYFPSMDSLIAVNVETSHVARGGFFESFSMKSSKIFNSNYKKRN